MIDTPQITQTTAQLLALIHVTIPRNESAIGNGSWPPGTHGGGQAQELSPAGPWFTHHLKMDPAIF